MNVSKISHSNVLKLGWGTFATIVALAIAVPSFAQSAISLGRNFRPDPANLTGKGGGNISIASIAGIADNCRGFANVEPNHKITLTETFPLLDLLVYTSNINDDPTMLIKGPNGIVICADDESGGRNPQANRRMPKGEYLVWVGSKNINQAFSYTLSLSEILQK
ncbi:MAG: hypothetical protein DCF20_18640 [Pseudanabaena sp.]|nr:MAG: hypothetical protein DCF20_18640 [Pseudanabaena sp.]